MTADLSPRPCGCVVRTRDGLLHHVCEAHAPGSPAKRRGLKQMSADVPRCDFDALVLMAAARGARPAMEVRRAIAEHVATYTRTCETRTCEKGGL